MIPVYGLSGIDAQGNYSTGAAFERYAQKIADAARRAAAIRAHAATMAEINGIYDTATAKIATGAAQPGDYADARKAQVLIILNNTDYDAFRLASHLMPFVIDIDDTDGGYYFATPEQAKVAAEAEDEYIKILCQPDAEETLDGFWKKLGKALGSGFKAIGTGTVAAAKSVVNATKATANTFKAAGQLITGDKAGAKETIKKAGNQFKASALDPWKAAYEAQKDIVNSNWELTKETVNIAGKVLKVLFIKINPVTVLLRNGLRSLIALNLAGMATKLNVGLLTQEEAAALGYGESAWRDAVKAVQRTKKLFKHMGGNPDKLEKSIRKGSKLPVPAVTSTTKFDMPTNATDDGEPTLGDPATIAATIAACLGMLIQIWNWIASIKTAKQAQREASQAMAANNTANKEAAEAELKALQKLYAFDSNGNFLLDANGNYITWEQYWADQSAAAQAAAQAEEDQKKNIMLAAAVGGGALLLLMAAMKRR